MFDKKRDSASMTSPTTSKPTPARTPSTRIQEPAIKPSSTTRTTTETTRSNTTAKSTEKPASNNGKSAKVGPPERPGLQRRRTTARTRYINMLLELDDVPKMHNILASFFTWVLLAGYIVFPATFNKFQKDEDLDNKADVVWKQKTLETVRNVPLLYIAAFACGIGILGCVWLWFAHRKNYVWVINRIFLPALMNSIAGLISTLVNVYSAQDGQYSVTAKITIIVTAACSAVAAALFLLYNTVMLAIVKRRHDREVGEVERQAAQEEAITTGGVLGAVGKDSGRIV